MRNIFYVGVFYFQKIGDKWYVLAGIKSDKPNIVTPIGGNCRLVDHRDLVKVARGKFYQRTDGIFSVDTKKLINLFVIDNVRKFYLLTEIPGKINLGEEMITKNDQGELRVGFVLLEDYVKMLYPWARKAFGLACKKMRERNGSFTFVSEWE